MNQEGKKTTLRTTVDMDFELKDAINVMAKEKKWSFSYMCYTLLHQAVKEKNRKKKKLPNSITN
jgi:hypothetical protein